MPLPVSGAFHTPFMAAGPRPAAQGDRRGRPPRHRGAGHLQRRRPPPRHGRRVGEPAVGAALQPGALEALPARARGRRASPSSSSSAPAACSPAWPSAPSTAPRTIAVSTPEDLDKLLEWVDAGAGAAPPHHRGRAPLRQRAPRRQPRRRRVHARRRARRRQRRSTSATVLGHVGDHEVRSPFAGVLQSYIAVDGERVTVSQPIAWLRRTSLTCQHYRPESAVQ